MLYLLSALNLFKNILVKLWSYTIVKVIVVAAFTFYVGEGFYSRVSSRMSNLNLEFPGWSTLFYIPGFEYNPNFVKSGKASFGIMNSIIRLASVFFPGLLSVGIILFLQKVYNNYKAPPLPIIYRAEDAEDVLVTDYRMPTLFTKGEDDGYDYDEDEDDDEEEYDEEEEYENDYDLANGGITV